MQKYLLLRIFGCILVTQKPFCAIEIEHLLSLRKREVRLTLRSIHSLLSVPKSEEKTIYLYVSQISPRFHI